MTDELLVWTDIETTGLNPHEDLILELAMCCEKFSVSELFPIYPTDLRLDSVVEEMHTRNGLLEACRLHAIRPPTQYPYHFIEILRHFKQGNPDTKLIMAGRSVHFDREFLFFHFPVLRDYFYHRVFDLRSVIKMMDDLGLEGMWEDFTDDNHRAMSDVQNDIKTYNSIRDYLYSTTHI